MVGKVNPWAEEAFKKLEARGKAPQGIPAVVEAELGKAGEVASQLRRLGYSVEGVVDDFVFVDLPEMADFDRVSRLLNVKTVSVQKRIYPMALGVDELFKRVAVATDPVLSKLDISDLQALGVRVKPAAELPTPFGALVTMVAEAFRFAADPLRRLMEYVKGFPPVIARADWKLVTDTRKLMEAPEDNRLSATYVGNIDTGIYPNPAIGLPLINWICDSITTELPLDSMGHGSWTHSCAFGQPCPTRFGSFVPVASAPKSYHVKVFTAFGPCTSFQIMKAMEMCALKGCKVVNMSLGGPLEGSVNEDPECVLAEKLYKEYGTNFIVAAGNDGEDWSINSPGASPHVLCVGAVDWKSMDTSSYSSRGPQAAWYKINRDAYDRDFAKYGDNFLKPDLAGIGGDRESQIVAAASLWYDAFYDFIPDGFELMIGTCLRRDTRILTNPCGVKRIDEIEPGDMVYTFDDGKLVPKRVRAVIGNGIKPIFQVKLFDRELFATDNHPVLTVERVARGGYRLRWKLVRDLKKGDLVVALKKLSYGNSDEPPEFFRFLGFMIGDGWITTSKGNYQVCFAKSAYSDINDMYVALAEKLFGKRPRLYEEGGWCYFYNKEAAEKLISWNLGADAHMKRIDPRVFAAPIQHRVEFLMGVLDADGCIQRVGNTVRYGIELSNEKLTRDLKLLAQTIGWKVSNAYYRRRNVKAPNSKESKEFETWTLIIYPTEPKLGASFGIGIGPSTPMPKALQNLLNWDVFMVREVQSVEPAGETEVFDIEVDGSHNFIAEGILVHNSMATPHVAGLAALAIDRGLVNNVEDVKAKMAFLGEKSADVGYGLLTWTKLK